MNAKTPGKKSGNRTVFQQPIKFGFFFGGGELDRRLFFLFHVMGTRTSGMKLLHEAGICLFTFLLAFCLFLQYLVHSISPQYLRPSVHSVFPFQILQWCSARPFIKTGERTDIFQYYILPNSLPIKITNIKDFFVNPFKLISPWISGFPLYTPLSNTLYSVREKLVNFTFRASVYCLLTQHLM